VARRRVHEQHRHPHTDQEEELPTQPIRQGKSQVFVVFPTCGSKQKASYSSAKKCEEWIHQPECGIAVGRTGSSGSIAACDPEADKKSNKNATEQNGARHERDQKQRD
jgi:hypothetical protein